MAAVYRLRATAHANNKDHALKAKSYYEKAIKDGETPRESTMISMMELDQVLGVRKPSNENKPVAGFTVKSTPKFDLLR